ncbi:MAG: nuclear transport factor 2 family protein [Deltaproteobacteria bacterium]|nr:nuclear transport factor 2 family protein [Deltaproteobacteria bacterium]MBW2363223.1 nuclear transport factor 2 family protein [Deltaproteobacteria bacterium]
MSEATTTVDNFIAAWSRRDVDELMSFFTEDAVYENVPIDPPSRGAEAIRKTLEQFAGTPTQIEFVVHQQTCTGSVVMNERTDRFEMGGKWAEIRVMGVFEVAGGKIKAWRDYFDLAQFTQQMTGQDG